MNALIIFLVTLGLDRFTKAWALKVLSLGLQSPTSFLNLVLTWNKGVSWGLFSTNNEWGARLLTFVICMVMFGFAWHTVRRTCYFQVVWCEGLVLGGAISNLIDRFLHGAVIDFIELHAFGYSFPVFNIADAAICLGVAGMLIRGWQQAEIVQQGCGKKRV
jgi:signal peptidase II